MKNRTARAVLLRGEAGHVVEIPPVGEMASLVQRSTANTVRLFNKSGIASMTGIPIPTVRRRLALNGVMPDAVLVLVSGGRQITHPLFIECRLPELAALVRPTPSSKRPTTAGR